MSTAHPPTAAEDLFDAAARPAPGFTPAPPAEAGAELTPVQDPAPYLPAYYTVGGRVVQCPELLAARFRQGLSL